MKRSRHVPCLHVVAIAVFALSGCHLLFGPEERGRGGSWYYCDAEGCVECDAKGCFLPRSRCDPEGPLAQCPPGSVCDPDARKCREATGCETGADCGAGKICVDGACLPAPSPCTSHADCGDGAYCSDGACVFSGRCSGDSDCAVMPGSFVCDERGSCVPDQPASQACQSGSQCPGGICFDGGCAGCAADCGGGRTCQLNRHCGDGRVCLDGQCANACVSDGDCGSGRRCKSGVCIAGGAVACLGSHECAGGQACVNGLCLPDCSATGTCASPLDVCSAAVSLDGGSARFCYADTAAAPECKLSADCLGGELCVNGVCRTSCASSDDCSGCPDGPVCGPGGFCMTSLEASPQCAVSKDCPSTMVCLDAQCVAL